MTSLADLRKRVQEKPGIATLEEYLQLAIEFLEYLQETNLTLIHSPKANNYVFYQYDAKIQYKITRPLNSDLFLVSADELKSNFDRFMGFLDDLKKYQGAAIQQRRNKEITATNLINKTIYTIQQSIGCITDSFDSQNQSRKQVGTLFERLVTLILVQAGVACHSRTIKIPVPGAGSVKMSYQLDIVFSVNQAIITSETKFIYPNEIVGSVKTTSKDRIDKVFLDKFLLSKLLGENIPTVAIFLHDVQRATNQDSQFGISSTFKKGHFLAYSVALMKLDGVYYVDPRPEMTTHSTLKESIGSFEKFLVSDLWTLSKKRS